MLLLSFLLRTSAWHQGWSIAKNHTHAMKNDHHAHQQHLYFTSPTVPLRKPISRQSAVRKADSKLRWANSYLAKHTRSSLSSSSCVDGNVENNDELKLALKLPLKKLFFNQTHIERTLPSLCNCIFLRVIAARLWLSRLVRFSIMHILDATFQMKVGNWHS